MKLINQEGGSIGFQNKNRLLKPELKNFFCADRINVMPAFDLLYVETMASSSLSVKVGNFIFRCSVETMISPVKVGNFIFRCGMETMALSSLSVFLLIKAK